MSDQKDEKPLDISVRAKPIEPKNGLIGFASVVLNGSFAVENISIRVSKEGNPYVQMPARQDKDGNWRDTFKPITPEARTQLNTAVLAAYEKAVDKSRAIADTAVQPSIKSAIKTGQEKVKAQPPVAAKPDMSRDVL